MAVPFSNTKLRPPAGFRNILCGLAREVLRSQPRDIYAFGTLYLEQLLKVRRGKCNSLKFLPRHMCFIACANNYYNTRIAVACTYNYACSFTTDGDCKPSHENCQFTANACKRRAKIVASNKDGCSKKKSSQLSKSVNLTLPFGLRVNF